MDDLQPQNSNVSAESSPVNPTEPVPWYGNPKLQIATWALLFVVLAAIGGLFYWRSLTPESERELASIRTNASQNSDRRKQLEEQLVDVTRQTLNASHKLRTVSQDQRAVALSELKSFAQTRKNMVIEALKTNPGIVLRTAIPKGLRAKMPADVQVLIEEEFQAGGKFEWFVRENAEKGEATFDYFIADQATRKRSKVFLEHEPLAKSGDLVRIQGIKIDAYIAAYGGNSGSVEVVEAAVTAGPAMKVLALLVNFQDVTSQPFLPDEIRRTIFDLSYSGSVANYFREGSYTDVSVTGEVRGWMTLSMNASCDYLQIANKAKQAAAISGVKVSEFNRYIYITPPGVCDDNNQPISGFGEIGGDETWTFGSVTTQHFAHGLGHNLGLHNSRGLLCHPQVIGEGLNWNDCSFAEYGHIFDVMGGGRGHFHAGQKERIGWINRGASRPVTTVTSSGTYSIAPYSSLTGSMPKALKIAKAPGVWYYLELRRNYGFDAGISNNANLTNGVMVVVQDENLGTENYMLDMTPETTSVTDPALAVNRTFTDKAAGITITPLAVDDTSAQIKVTVGNAARCANTAPLLAVKPASQSGPAGTTLTYNLALKNADSADCPVSTYVITPTLPTGWFMTPSSMTMRLRPGETKSFAVSVNSSDTATGNTSFSLITKSVEHNKASKPVTASYIVTSTSDSGAQAVPAASPKPTTAKPTITGTGDRQAPTVEISSPKAGSKVSAPSSVQIDATANDASGMSSIKILVNGIAAKTCSNANSCTVNVAADSLPAGVTTISITAADKAHVPNLATKSITITK